LVLGWGSAAYTTANSREGLEHIHNIVARFYCKPDSPDCCLVTRSQFAMRPYQEGDQNGRSYRLRLLASPSSHCPQPGPQPGVGQLRRPRRQPSLHVLARVLKPRRAKVCRSDRRCDVEKGENGGPEPPPSHTSLTTGEAFWIRRTVGSVINGRRFSLPRNWPIRRYVFRYARRLAYRFLCRKPISAARSHFYCISSAHA
jgi:hypothetical protein